MGGQKRGNDQSKSTIDDNHHIETDKGTTSSESEMSSAQVASHPVSPGNFLADLFRDQGVTNINFISDNAKPRATVPRSVYMQSPKSEKASRWESIPRVNSADSMDYRSRRVGRKRASNMHHSLSPTPLYKTVTSMQNQRFPKHPTPHSVGDSSSRLPVVLRKNLMELVAPEERVPSPGDRLRQVAGICGPLMAPTRQMSIDALNPESEEPVRAAPALPRKSSSQPSLHTASIDSIQNGRRVKIKDHSSGGGSKKSKSSRRRRRASMDALTTATKERTSSSPRKNGSKTQNASWWIKGNASDTTQALTPSPTSPLKQETSDLLRLANGSVKHPPLTSPSTSPACLRKSSRRSSTGGLSRTPRQTRQRSSQRNKSPTPLLPGTPPSLGRDRRKSLGKSPKKAPPRPKSPPLDQPGTPPSLRRDHKGRRHSDGIIDIDQEVSKKLLHLAQAASPKQPVKQNQEVSKKLSHSAQVSLPVKPVRQESLNSFGDDSLEIQIAEPRPSNAVLDQIIADDLESDEERDDPVEKKSALDKAKDYIGSQDLNDVKDTIDSPSKSVRFSPKVKFYSEAEKKIPMVTFSPKRMHSSPLKGVNPYQDGDEDESALLASFRRRKPFSPGSGYTKTSLITKKNGETRYTTTKERRPSIDRGIIKESLRKHGSDEDLQRLMHSSQRSTFSTESREKTSLSYLLPQAPTLDTPPQVKKKKSPRRTSMPPLAPDVTTSSSSPKTPKSTKKKNNRRRSLL